MFEIYVRHMPERSRNPLKLQSVRSRQSIVAFQKRVKSSEILAHFGQKPKLWSSCIIPGAQNHPSPVVIDLVAQQICLHFWV